MIQEIFLITGDISDGIDGQDKSSVSVWDVSSWEQCAHWHGYRDPFEMAYIMRDLGAYYGWAMIAVETNYPGNATYKKLQELQYPKLWVDVETGNPWLTTNKSRPLAITALRESMRDGTMKINSPDTISELRTFVRRTNGKLEAEQGSHDDCIMDAAIAAYILKNTAFEPQALKEIRRQPLREILRVTDYRFKQNRKEGIV
jgi:hypothetical protein